jgi:hypothetical protein
MGGNFSPTYRQGNQTNKAIKNAKMTQQCDEVNELIKRSISLVSDVISKDRANSRSRSRDRIMVSKQQTQGTTTPL